MKRAPKALDVTADKRAYAHALKKCQDKRGKSKSRCVREVYLNKCQANNNGAESSECLDQSRTSRLLDKYQRQKWVYLAPYLRGEKIMCGSRSKMRGRSCRPTVKVKGARARTVDELLKDPEWLKAWHSGGNVRKLNRMAAYKDARTTAVIMYWNKGTFYDKSTKTMNNFRPFYDMSENQFRKLIADHSPEVAKAFSDMAF